MEFQHVVCTCQIQNKVSSLDSATETLVLLGIIILETNLQLNSLPELAGICL